MPRGRHRHSPPLHRLLPPSAIAGVSLVCALGPWLFTQATALRVLAAAAAATAIVGAVVMRHWDVQAGKQVADLTRARAGDEWRFEERVAELESDLEESRELRVKLEQRLRAKRAELAGLRNEHAALLRRYATAETERATALEGRRLLEIEAAPSPASLPAARGPQDTEPTEPAEPTVAEAAETTEAVEAGEALPGTSSASEASGSAASGESEPVESVESSGSGAGSATSAVFSPHGSQLFLRAQAALARLDADADAAVEASEDEPGDDLAEGSVKGAAGEGSARAASVEAAQEDEGEGKPEAVDEHTRATALRTAAGDAATENDKTENDKTENDKTENDKTENDGTGSDGGTAREARPDDAPSGASSDVLASDETPSTDRTATDLSRAGVLSEDETDSVAEPLDPGPVGAGRDPDPDPDPGPGPGRGTAHAAEPAAAAATEPGAVVRRPAAPVQRPSGHFAVPTAVAVVPAAEPVRRPTAEGGFDFFGTKSDAEPDALEAVQNEDLADVVGQEALALHKAESEAEFKPADEAARAVGQVIDLTAHDETEHIDLQGLRSAVS
ncbi:hypothetical protein [Streptomyces sp. NPDC048481]|uniref:hypothetical protein n=1 Tax=Streptomyces sp. NPDC048481 TaxID=3365557 RepID=UPI00371CF522